ncbi:putative membrane protein [Arcanobacterium pluranimalium]|nr:putative membrane protein [Arcanobacterium pluranimalium]
MNNLRKTITQRIANSSRPLKILIATITAVILLVVTVTYWQVSKSRARSAYHVSYDAYEQAITNLEHKQDKARAQQKECEANSVSGQNECADLFSVLERAQKIERINEIDDDDPTKNELYHLADHLDASAERANDVSSQLARACEDAHQKLLASSKLWRDANLKPWIDWSKNLLGSSQQLLGSSDGKVTDPQTRNTLADQVKNLEELVKNAEDKYESSLYGEARKHQEALAQAHAATQAALTALQASMASFDAAQGRSAQVSSQRQTTTKPPVSSSRAGGASGGASKGSGGSVPGVAGNGTTPGPAGGSSGGSTGGQNGWVETGSEDQCLKFDTQGNSWSVPC